MDSDRPTTTVSPAPAQLAKGALRRLAQARLEPTPSNFARAYAEEAGAAVPAAGAASAAAEGLPAKARAPLERLAMRATDDAAQRGELVANLMAARWEDAQRLLERHAAPNPAQQAQAWAVVIERLARGLERGGRHWTAARKKSSLQRVLDGGRSDVAQLQQRLRQVLATWDADEPDADVEAAPDAAAAADVAAAVPGAAAAPEAATPEAAAGRGAGAAFLLPAEADAAPVQLDHHPQVISALQTTVRAGLPADEPRAQELADELAALADRVAAEGATIALAEAVGEVCLRVRRLFGLRHELVQELLGMTRALTEGMTELAEEGSWAQGQSAGLRARLDGATNARAVRAARALLDDTRQQQRNLQRERLQARDALKQMVQQVLSELGTLDSTTGAYSERVQAYADVIEQADSLDSLGEVVRELVSDSRAVHTVVAGARDRLASEHDRATELETRVRTLESELRRLSDEVSTDMLTQVANRRGLAVVFEQERARIDREGADAAPLAIGLIDIDNFKKLNDTLGHAAGDVALKSLAARVKEWLRPIDHVARFGGEEFVVLLPGTAVQEAQQVLTRLQRQLTASLFMHDGKEVFVTFSAGVTPYRLNEALELALERADEALYEAKRTGKNRTCIA